MARRLGLVVLTVLLATPAWTVADTRIVRERLSDSLLDLGRSADAGSSVTVMTLGPSGLRVDHGGTSLIVRSDEEEMYVLDHEGRRASVVGLPVDVKALLPPQLAEQMLTTMQFEITVRPTDETKKIGPWRARRVDVTMVSALARVESKVWLTDDLAESVDDDALRRLHREVVAFQPGMGKVADELARLKGVEVASETVMVMSAALGKPVTSSERVTSVEEVEVPPGTYDIPAGYTVVPLDFAALSSSGR